MATPHKTAEGTWRIQISVRGQRVSETFPTKREAQVWADRRKTEMRAVASGQAGQIKTLADALARYGREVSSTKRGSRWELIRLQAFLGPAHAPLPVSRRMADITPDDLAAWRDARLRQCAPGTVLRDITLLSNVFTVARREWRWIAVNPVSDMRRPPEPPHRMRTIGGPEIRAMLRALGHARGPIPPGSALTVSQAVALCFLLALATGMRAGELCVLRWADVHPDFVRLPASKTFAGVRDVPLTFGARRVLERLRGRDGDKVFGLDKGSLDALFRRARIRAGLEGFTFHDSRHTAATWIAQRLHVLDLCKMLGWKKTDHAMIYYQPKASDMAKRLVGK